MKKKLFISSCLLLLITMGIIRSSFAYIDPATTSYGIQILAGVIIAFGATIGVFWKKIKVWFIKMKNSLVENKIRRDAEVQNNKKRDA